MASFENALPDDPYTPTGIVQRFFAYFVPRDIGANLLTPELFARGRPLKQMTAVTVPEATVNKKYRPVFWEYQIRASWKISIMQSETETAGMYPPADYDFGFGVKAPDGRHIPASGRLVVNVNQLCLVSPLGSLSATGYAVA